MGGHHDLYQHFSFPRLEYLSDLNTVILYHYARVMQKCWGFFFFKSSKFFGRFYGLFSPLNLNCHGFAMYKTSITQTVFYVKISNERRHHEIQPLSNSEIAAKNCFNLATLIYPPHKIHSRLTRICSDHTYQQYYAYQAWCSSSIHLLNSPSVAPRLSVAPRWSKLSTCQPSLWSPRIFM